jgi:uncharacterized protein (UPF0179 family)
VPRVEIQAGSSRVCRKQCRYHQLCVPSMLFEGKSYRLKEAAEKVAKRAVSA